MINIIVKNPDSLAIEELCRVITKKIMPIKYRCEKIEEAEQSLLMTARPLPWIDPPHIRLKTEVELREKLGIYG